ncbi:Pycsar system effector family protein [Chitinophagaceae bacterium LWZ2-11]
MNYAQLLEDVKAHIIEMYVSHPNNALLYHNKSHTESVVEAAEQIADHYQLDDTSYFIVVCAAWFHDIGYLMDTFEGHEEKGAEAAVEFLKSKNVDEQIIQQVQGCIRATKMPQHPKDLLEQIVCDADLSHLGSTGYKEKTKLLRKEVELVKGIEIDKNEWDKRSIGFIENHKYFTDYSQLRLNKTQAKNLEDLKKKVKEHTKKEEKDSPEKVAEKASEKTEKAHHDKKERPDKGIETMFRITSGNHQRLSDMADSKAHIMITVNSIIVSVLLSLLLRKLDDYPNLVIPSMMLLSVNVTTIIFSVLATRPTIPKGTFTREDIENKSVNLLFFGNFYNMSFDEYNNGMQHVMDDREFLYGSLTRDVYSQGVVLGKKYKLLRISYNVFMFGIVASVLAFAIASTFFSIN